MLLLRLLLLLLEFRLKLKWGRVANDDGKTGVAALRRLRASSIILNIFAQELVVDFEVIDVGAI